MSVTLPTWKVTELCVGDQCGEITAVKLGNLGAFKMIIYDTNNKSFI